MSEILQKNVRKYIVEYFLENEHPPLIEEVMARFDMKRADAHRILLSIEEAHNLVLLPGTQRILMAHPFSAIATPFRVTIGSKRYYGNCAWDAVAFHIMLSRDIHIDSFCHHCSERISIDLKNGRAMSKPPKPLVFLSMPAAKWWDSIVNTCSNNMVFFSSQRHLNEWLSENPDLEGETLTVEKTVELSRSTYTGKMELDYKRLPKDELMKRWAAIGLMGDFWKL